MPDFDAGDKMTAGNLSSGELGYAEITATQLGFTSAAIITGLSVTVDVTAGHLIMVTVDLPGLRQDVADGIVVGTIRESSSVLKRYITHSLENGQFASAHGSVRLLPSAGSHTYEAWILATAGEVDVLADASTSQGPAWIQAVSLGAT